MSQDSATADVVRFVADTHFSAIPVDALNLAKRCVLDGLGVMLAGSTAPASRLQQEHIQADGSKGEATVLGRTPFRASASAAALANGTSGHAMDWDDTQLSTTPDRVYGLMTHPTIPPLAAGLAVGEKLKATGAAL